MAVSINSISIPSSINQRGYYVYTPYTVTRINGAGASVSAGLPSAVWTFPRLSPSAYTWWVTTLLGGAASITCPARLWDDKDTETDFSSVTVRYPTYRKRTNGYYHDVEVRIDTMVKS